MLSIFSLLPGAIGAGILDRGAMYLGRSNLPVQQPLKKRGQTMVELALLMPFVVGLLAGALDLGRLAYTAAVVENMAGEGALFAASYPDQDAAFGDFTQKGCSLLPVARAYSIQERVRRVAQEHGLVVDVEDQDSTRIDVYANGDPGQVDCHNRVAGGLITVKVTYPVSDLFLPSIFLFGPINITKESTQVIVREVQVR